MYKKRIKLYVHHVAKKNYDSKKIDIAIIISYTRDATTRVVFFFVFWMNGVVFLL